MKKHNVNNRERERNGGRGERERERKDRSDAACTRYKGMQGGGECRVERRWGRASRKTSGFAARSGLVAAVASERVRMKKGAATK